MSAPKRRAATARYVVQTDSYCYPAEWIAALAESNDDEVPQTARDDLEDR